MAMRVITNLKVQMFYTTRIAGFTNVADYSPLLDRFSRSDRNLTQVAVHAVDSKLLMVDVVGYSRLMGDDEDGTLHRRLRYAAL